MVRGIESPCVEERKMKATPFSYKDNGSSTYQIQESTEQFYQELNDMRQGSTFEELLEDANNPSRFARKQTDEELNTTICFSD